MRCDALRGWLLRSWASSGPDECALIRGVIAIRSRGVKVPIGPVGACAALHFNSLRRLLYTNISNPCASTPTCVCACCLVLAVARCSPSPPSNWDYKPLYDICVYVCCLVFDICVYVCCLVFTDIVLCNAAVLRRAA